MQYYNQMAQNHHKSQQPKEGRVDRIQNLFCYMIRLILYSVAGLEDIPL